MRVRSTVPCMLLVSAPAIAQNPVPIRHVTMLAHTDSGVLGGIFGVRQLPDGRVLVNDMVRHRVLAFDSTLAQATAVLDSTAGAANSYGTQRGTIFPYVGDSTVFVDAAARAFILLDPAAHVTRTMAPPRPQSIFSIAAAVNAAETYDSRGQFIFFVSRPTPSALSAAPRNPADTMAVTILHDTAAILRIDPNAATADTVGLVALPFQKGIEFRLSDSRSVGYAAFNPLPQTDEWAVLSDGTVAFVRGQDYHVDFVHPDGTKSSSPKLPFDWRRVTLEDKQRMIDSARQAFDAMVAKLPPPAPRPPGAQAPLPRRFYAVDPSDMPDYHPPIRQGQVRADRDGNLWILPTTSTAAASGFSATEAAPRPNPDAAPPARPGAWRSASSRCRSASRPF